MDDERTLPCLVGSQKCRERLLEPADHELHTGILDVRNRASRAECSFGEHWGPVFRQTLEGVEAKKAAVGMDIRLAPPSQTCAAPNSEFHVVYRADRPCLHEFMECVSSRKQGNIPSLFQCGHPLGIPVQLFDKDGVPGKQPCGDALLWRHSTIHVSHFIPEIAMKTKRDIPV